MRPCVKVVKISEDRSRSLYRRLMLEWLRSSWWSPGSLLFPACISS